jgi:hypothetical protein
MPWRTPRNNTWFKPLLDPLQGSGWIGNRVLLGSTPPDRDTTVTWGVFFKGAVCRENKFEKVLRDPESIFFDFSHGNSVFREVVLDVLDPTFVYTFICVEIKTNSERVASHVFQKVQTTLVREAHFF